MIQGEIFTLSGQRIGLRKFTSNRMDVSDLPSGNYLALLEFRNGTSETIKFTKQ